jgi:predicted dehydrogenase
MANELNRRNFLKAAAIAAGPAVIKARGANEKINIGWIGVGTRGDYGIQWLHDAAADDCNLVAICDTCGPYLERGIANVQKTWGNTPKTFKDYRELLADKSIDAVYIMTPEHLHRNMAIAAFEAGKHVYVEKPMAHTIEEGWDIIKAWEKSGKVCQVGTQNRSSLLYKTAKEWIEKGLIGEVHYARAFWYRNALGNGNAAWRYDIPPFKTPRTGFQVAAATPENTDWNRFLGPAPKRAWDPHRYFQWRLYWDYSGGISTDLLVHQTDIINFMVGKTLPKSVVASGGVYRWTKDDDRDAADTLSAVYEYPGNFHINYSSYLGNARESFGEHIYGSEGTIVVENRWEAHFYPETYSGVPANVKARKEIHVYNDAAPQVRAGTVKSDFKEVDGVLAHFRNFINSVKGTEKPITPPPIGQEGAIGGHMATMAYRNKKMVLWDGAAKKAKLA